MPAQTIFDPLYATDTATESGFATIECGLVQHYLCAATKTENSMRTVPLPAYLIPELKRWKLACPVTARGLVFPGEPNEQGERGPIEADKLLRNILRRALRRAGLPPLRFHDMRHLAGTLMSEARVPPKRAQEILGHADVRTTLAIYTHAMRRKHDDSADKMAELAGLTKCGNIVETFGSVESEESELSRCSDGSPGCSGEAATTP